MFDPGMVEAVARKARDAWIARCVIAGEVLPWGDMEPEDRDAWMAGAAEHLTALCAHLNLPPKALTALAAGEAVVVPRELTDELRAVVWWAQYQHANARLDVPESAAVVEHCVRKRVQCEEQRAQDHAAYAAQLAATPFTPGA